MHPLARGCWVGAVSDGTDAPPAEPSAAVANADGVGRAICTSAAPLGASEVSGVPAVVALQQVEPGPRSDGFEPVAQVPAQDLGVARLVSLAGGGERAA